MSFAFYLCALLATYIESALSVRPKTVSIKRQWLAERPIVVTYGAWR
jgi:hypothetical protein